MPSILLTATTWWPSTARLALALREAGADVSVLAPTGNPANRIRGIRHSPYAAFLPLPILEHTLERLRPNLVVPMDDRATGHLHLLHGELDRRGATGAAMRSITRSLGRPDFFSVLDTRAPLLTLLAEDDRDVAPTERVESIEDIRRWRDARSGAFVVKIEGSWGGSGVLIAEDLDATSVRAIKAMQRPLTLRRAARLALFDKDNYPLGQWRHHQVPKLAIQPFVPGRPANLMAACWQGQLLGCVSAEVLRSQGRTGAATIVRVARNPRMEETAARVAGRFGISGFIGLDFILERGTGRPVLIEVNPRATQLGHLPIDGDQTLASLLLRASAGEKGATAVQASDDRVLAFFPQALRFRDEEEMPELAQLDVPWNEPALVSELLRRPWTKRSLLSRVETAIRRNPAYGGIIPRAAAETIQARLGSFIGRSRSGSVDRPEGLTNASTI